MVDLQPESTGEYRNLILKRLRPGDIQTQIYSRLAPVLDAGNNVQPWMGEARQRGVLFDVGHGSSGFWFRIAVPAIGQGFLPDTISTGLDRESALLPRATMMDVLSKFLSIGLTLEQVVERSTAKPARAIRRPDLGTLSEGAIADIALLQLQKGSFGYLDSGHGKLLGDRKLRCVLTIRNGAIVWDSEGLSAPDWMKAGPYSNFK
jgi:dihydroorotase